MRNNKMGRIDINMQSKYLYGSTDVTIVTPEQITEKKEKYKVLWLLHGGNFDRNIWLNYTNLARYIADRNVVAICPNGLNSDFANHPEFADGYYFENYFFEELMPFVHQWFPVSSLPEDNYLAGYSMGAAATWSYGLSHSELFAGIAPIGSLAKNYSYLKEYKELSGHEFRLLATANRKRFLSAFGNPKAGILPKEINMISKYDSVQAFLDSNEHTIDRLMAIEENDELSVYLPCDSGEKSYQKVKEFSENLSQTFFASKITFDFTDKGISGYDFCDAALLQTLNFFNLK